MARLTWQTVATPNFNDSAYMLGSAGEDISKGLTGLGGIAGKVDQDQKAVVALERKRMEDAMYQKALAGSDLGNADNWSRIISAAPASRVGDIVSAFGDQSELMTEGVDRNKTRADTLKVGADTSKVYSDIAEQAVDTRQKTFDLGTGIRKDNRDEEQLALDEVSAAMVSDMVPNTATKEDAKKSIAQMEGLTPKERKSMFAALENVDDSRFGQDQNTITAFRNSPESQALEKVFAAEEQELATQKSMIPALKYLSIGSDAGSIDGGVTAAITKIVDETWGAEAKQKFEDSPGEVARELNKLQTRWKGKVSPEIVTGIYLSMVESADMAFWSEEKLQANIGAIEEELARIDTPEERQRLSDVRVGFEQQREALAEKRERYNRAEALAGAGGFKGGKVGEQFLGEANRTLQDLLYEVAPPKQTATEMTSAMAGSSGNMTFGAMAQPGQMNPNMGTVGNGIPAPVDPAAANAGAMQTQGPARAQILDEIANGYTKRNIIVPDSYTRSVEQARKARGIENNRAPDLSQIVGDVAREVGLSENEATAIDMLLGRVRNGTATPVEVQLLEGLQRKALAALE